jgi:pimeloyl-ACP methyl ester carboxylesterase
MTMSPTDLIPHGPRGHIESEGEQIYFETFGDPGLEAVVFSHGLGGNRVIWFQQVPEFARSYHVINWDQRGFGRSSARAGEIGPIPAARDLVTILDYLEVDRAHLIGQSMGGWTSMAFAVEHPDRVISLVLADSIAGIYTPAVREHYTEFIGRESSRRSEGNLAIGQHAAIGDKFRQTDLIRAFLFEQIGAPTPETMRAMRELLLRTEYPPDSLARLSCPVLFIVGSEDRIFPPDIIRDAASCVPGSHTIEIPETAHSPYFESPNEWNRIVFEFLASQR